MTLIWQPIQQLGEILQQPPPEFAGNGPTHHAGLWATHTLGTSHCFAAAFLIKHFEFKFNLLKYSGNDGDQIP